MYKYLILAAGFALILFLFRKIINGRDPLAGLLAFAPITVGLFWLVLWLFLFFVLDIQLP